MIRVLALWLALVSCLILSFILREERLIAKGKIPSGRLRRIWFRPERRRAPRYRVNCSIRYERLLSNHSEAAGKTWDVSRTGAALILEERLDFGALLRLELRLAENTAPLTIEGKVVWVRQLPLEKKAPEKRLFLTGIQFKHLDPKTETLLQKSLSRHV